MESEDSLPILTDLDFIFPTLTPSALEQPAEPVVPLLSPPAISIPSNPASPDEQSDTASTTRGLSSVTGYSIATFTTDQQPIPTLASSVGNVKSKNSSSRRARTRARPKRVRKLRRHTSKDFQKGDRLTLACQHKREYFAQLARAVKKPRFNPHLCHSLKPEYSSWKLIFLGQPATGVHHTEHTSSHSEACCSAVRYYSQSSALIQIPVYSS